MGNERGPEPAAAPSEKPVPKGPRPRGRSRALVWSLIAVASVLLVFSLVANWVQGDALDSEWVADTTDEILADASVREALAVYAVDQLFANVDVRGELEKQLPGPTKALAAPAAAATRQLALDLERRALASPRVQDAVSNAIAFAHEQFVALITGKDGYLATADGEVTLRYGDVIADLAVRIGVDPSTVSDVRRVAGELEAVEPRLKELQGRVRSARAELATARTGQLSPEAHQRLEALQAGVAEIEEKVVGLRRGIATVRGKAPPPLVERLARIDGRLADLEAGLGRAGERLLAVRGDPRVARIAELDAFLARVEERLGTLLGRQLVQQPGELVLLGSTQLEAVQSVMAALRGLGLVLPVLVLLLYAGALYLARAWRPRALLAAGAGIVAAALILLAARRATGGAVVDSLAGSTAVEPAILAVWDALTGGLRERALFVLVVGVAFVGAGLLAGSGRRATAARRVLAPHLRDRPVAVYSVVGLLFLLWLAFMPGVLGAGQLIAVVGLAVLAVVGIEALRRQVAAEFPTTPRGP
jgi:hypothetical protein